LKTLLQTQEERRSAPLKIWIFNSTNRFGVLHRELVIHIKDDEVQKE